MSKTVSTNYQYPYPPEPRNWGPEERQFSQGIRRLFDTLFARKLQNIMIADHAVSARTIADNAIGMRHLVAGFGKALDISSNETVLELSTSAGAARQTADSAVSAAAAAQSMASEAHTVASGAAGLAHDAQIAADDAVETANDAVEAVAALPDILFPVGAIVMMDEAPSFGTWEEVDLGLQDVTAWRRVEEGENNGGNAD